MFVSRSGLSRTLVGLCSFSVLLSLTTACRGQLDAVVTSYPALAPYLGGNPTPPPFILKSGNIRGFVFGAAGKEQKLALAFVSNGAVSSFTGNPDENAQTDDDDGKAKQAVLHDFDDDDEGEVLAERRPRKKPVGTKMEDKYIYLRKGEFFLEDVPEGISTLSARFGDVKGPQSKVTVFANATVTDANLTVFLPTQVTVEDGSSPDVVDWDGLTPGDGISLTVTRKEGGDGRTETAITYDPSPPNVGIRLQSPPGSSGATIRGVRIVYRPDKDSKLKPITVSFPVTPTIVPPAQATTPGAPINLVLPIGNASILNFYNGETQPGLIIADIRFSKDPDATNIIQKSDFADLLVSVVLRRL